MSQRGPSNPYCDSGAAARMEHANPRSAFTSIFLHRALAENIIWLLFSSYYRCAGRESIRDTALTDNERSCQQMLITTELQQSVQSVTLLSGN